MDSILTINQHKGETLSVKTLKSGSNQQFNKLQEVREGLKQIKSNNPIQAFYVRKKVETWL